VLLVTHRHNVEYSYIMDPFSIAGLGLEALGLSVSVINWIKKTAGKKLRITPHEVESVGKHWISTQIIVQNKSEEPLFDIQIVCWLEKDQEIKIKPRHMQQMQDLGGGLKADTAFYLINGNAKGRPIKLLEFSRIMPKESFEIEVQIHRKGLVKFIPMRYSLNKPRIDQKFDDGGLAVPFSVPFEMNIEGMAIWLQKDSKSI